MFELNLASLPNYILYLEGIQLSYVKVFVQIFNLWYSNKPCFITNAEFAKRTDLHRDTVINAIQFFEKHNVLKRVQKGTKRYLVQVTRSIETESEAVDKSEENCTNIAMGSELDQGGVGVRPPQGSELDHHNNKYNNKYKKSFCNDQKENRTKQDFKYENRQKHEFADSMDKMASEKRHIEDHEEIKRAPMPDNLRQLIKSIKPS